MTLADDGIFMDIPNNSPLRKTTVEEKTLEEAEEAKLYTDALTKLIKRVNKKEMQH